MVDLIEALLVAGIGIAAAAVGYAIREYQNRVTPFFHVTEVDGGTLQDLQIVQIDQNLQNLLSTSAVLPKLLPANPLVKVNEARKRALRIQKGWPEVRQALDAVVTAFPTAGDEDLCAALDVLFASRLFEDWLRRLLGGNRVNPPDVPEGLPNVIQIHESEEKRGSIWVDYPGIAIQPRQFGKGMQEPVIRTRWRPFIDALKALHRPSVEDLLGQFRNAMEVEFQTALQAAPLLEDIVDNHSRWRFDLFFANLSSSPVMIRRIAKLVVIDGATGARYPENCRLLLLERTAEKVTRIDRGVPLLLRGQSDREFSYVTIKTQGQMEAGDSLRDAFNEGRATYQLEIQVLKTGFVKQQVVRSSVASFA